MSLSKPQKHGNNAELLSELQALLQKYQVSAPQTTTLPPIVKPAVLATNGDLTLYADWSIGSAAVDAYTAGYKGPGYPVYGFFTSDALSAFPQIASDPTGAGSVAYNQAQLFGPFGDIADWQQGCAATLAPDGHGYVHGSVHAIRGTLATHYKTTDFPALVETWQKSNFYPIQVEQGAGGDFYAHVAK